MPRLLSSSIDENHVSIVSYVSSIRGLRGSDTEAFPNMPMYKVRAVLSSSSDLTDLTTDGTLLHMTF